MLANAALDDEVVKGRVFSIGDFHPMGGKLFVRAPERVFRHEQPARSDLATWLIPQLELEYDESNLPTEYFDRKWDFSTKTEEMY